MLSTSSLVFLSVVILRGPGLEVGLGHRVRTGKCHQVARKDKSTGFSSSKAKGVLPSRFLGCELRDRREEESVGIEHNDISKTSGKSRRNE